MTTDQNDHEWRKPTLEGGPDTGVEVAATPDGIAIRHSDDPGGVTLMFTKAELAAFIAGCKAGEFDDIR